MTRHPDAQEAARREARREARQEARRNKSVVPYLVILIAAAFVLLIIAYFMQQRTAESVAGLNQSANSFRTIDQLVEDNRALHETVSQLQQELRRAEDDNKALTDQVAQLQAQLAAAQEELDALLSPEESEAQE